MNDILFPIPQSEHFSEPNLRALFESGIIQSTAVGRDGVRLPSFAKIIDQEVALISYKISTQAYRFTNYKERLILRGAERLPRQISIPTIRDRLTLRATCNTLSQLAPTAVPRPPHSIIKSIVSLIRSSSDPLSFVRIDVRNFYPSIDHAILIRALKSLGTEGFLTHLIDSAISTPTGASRERPIRGVPQGLSISNILASIYMTEYDLEHGENYFRYVDDILLVEPSYSASRAFKSEFTRLSALRLEAHPPGVKGKSQICRLGEGIEYLGYLICPDKVSVRHSSYKKMFANLLRIITQYKYRRKDDAFILRLNLRITGCIVDGKRRGWLLFFSQTEDLSQLRNLDRFLINQLGRVKFGIRGVEIKRFIKAYYEIRFNGCTGNYITNFDKFNLTEKIEFISKLKEISPEKIIELPIDIIDMQFQTLVSREVQELDKDVIGTIS